MIFLKVFGYSITIRKERKRNPMDTRAYHAEIIGAKMRATDALKREIGRTHGTGKEFIALGCTPKNFNLSRSEKNGLNVDAV